MSTVVPPSVLIWWFIFRVLAPLLHNKQWICCSGENGFWRQIQKLDLLLLFGHSILWWWCKGRRNGGENICKSATEKNQMHLSIVFFVVIAIVAADSGLQRKSTSAMGPVPNRKLLTFGFFRNAHHHCLLLVLVQHQSWNFSVVA